MASADPRGGGWASGFEAGERDGLGALRLDGDMGMGLGGGDAMETGDLELNLEVWK